MSTILYWLSFKLEVLVTYTCVICLDQDVVCLFLSMCTYVGSAEVILHIPSIIKANYKAMVSLRYYVP
jgi:hypothetical protein